MRALLLWLPVLLWRRLRALLRDFRYIAYVARKPLVHALRRRRGLCPWCGNEAPCLPCGYRFRALP